MFCFPLLQLSDVQHTLLFTEQFVYNQIQRHKKVLGDRLGHRSTGFHCVLPCAKLITHLVLISFFSSHLTSSSVEHVVVPTVTLLFT